MDVVSACLAVLGKRSLDSLLSSNPNNSMISLETIEEISFNNAKRQATKKEKFKNHEPKQNNEDTKLTSVSPPTLNRFNGMKNEGMEWGQKEWMMFVQDLLLFLHDNDQKNEHEKLYLDQLQQLPSEFGKESQVYCFPVKGLVVPSGNADGKVWKPSQGARDTGNCMVKRYYYHKDQQDNQIKRQISWLRDCGDYTFFDYRSNFKGKVKLNQLRGPVNWSLLVELVNQFSEKRKRENPSPPTTLYHPPSEINPEIYSPTIQIIQKSNVCIPNGFISSNAIKFQNDPFMESAFDVDSSLNSASPQWNWEGLNAINFYPIALGANQ